MRYPAVRVPDVCGAGFSVEDQVYPDRGLVRTLYSLGSCSVLIRYDARVVGLCARCRRVRRSLEYQCVERVG